MKRKKIFSKFILLFSLCVILSGISINFATTENELEDVTQLVNDYVKYIKNGEWESYVGLFNYPDEVGQDLLKFLNDKSNQKSREGILGINNIKFISMEPTTDRNLIDKGQLVFDVYFDMNVNKETKFYENGVSLHTFVMNYIDGKLSLDAVYYSGVIDKQNFQTNALIPIEPSPYPIPSTIRIYITATGTLKTINFATYVKDVTPNEIYITWPTESLKANIIAQKSFAAYQVFKPRTPALSYGADVTDKWQNYQKYVEGSNKPVTNNLYDYLYDVLMVKGQEPFESFYSAGTVGVPGNQGGGYLSQNGTVVLANSGKSYLDILHYYYTTMVVCQFNPYAHVIR